MKTVIVKYQIFLLNLFPRHLNDQSPPLHNKSPIIYNNKISATVSIGMIEIKPENLFKHSFLALVIFGSNMQNRNKSYDQFSGILKSLHAVSK